MKRPDIKYILKNYGIVIAFFAICVILSILSPVFLTSINIINIVRQTSIYGIMAVGMTFVILTGGIDLSVGSLLAISGVACAGMLRVGFGPFPAILVTLLVGSFFGLINGIIINAGKITPFVVTLGMMSIARGLTMLYTKGISHIRLR
jgi:ribose/xylose/arabinose/galactoside ABC-type transport system permease subunit